ncbi:MAG: hypothetical protein ACK42L_10155 [Thermoanaerobaculum sp.]
MRERSNVMIVLLALVVASGVAFAAGPWHLADSKTGHIRSAVTRESKGTPRAVSGAVVLPEGFTPIASAGGFFAGWLCPGCGEGEEADWAVLDSSGAVLYRSPIGQWQLNQQGDGMSLAFTLPDWVGALRLLDLPSSLADAEPKLVVQSCTLPERRCRTDIYKMGRATLHSFLAVRNGDVLVVCETERSRFVARLQQGRVVWQTDVSDFLHPALWDLNWQRQEILLGDGTLSTVKVFSVDSGLERFRWQGPAELLRGTKDVLAEAKGECQARGGLFETQSLASPAGFPEGWNWISGFLRLEGGRILSNGELLLLGGNGFGGLGLDCKGHARVVRVGRSTGEVPSLYVLPNLISEKRCESAYALERTLQVSREGVYVCCSEGCVRFKAVFQP